MEEISKNPIKGFDHIQKILIGIRDDNTCQFLGCNNKGELSIHHIVPRSFAFHVLGWRMVDINDTKNGIMLCHYHHNLIHKGYEKKEHPWNEEWDKDFKKTIITNREKCNFEEMVYV